MVRIKNMSTDKIADMPERDFANYVRKTVPTPMCLQTMNKKRGTSGKMFFEFMFLDNSHMFWCDSKQFKLMLKAGLFMHNQTRLQHKLELF